MNDDNINNYLPSLLNPRAVRKQHNLSLTQSSFVSRCSLSLKRPNGLSTVKPLNKVTPTNKENSPNAPNLVQEVQTVTKSQIKKRNIADNDSLGFSAIEDLQSIEDFSPPSTVRDIDFNNTQKDVIDSHIYKDNDIEDSKSDITIAISSVTELENIETKSVSTIIYNVDKPTIKVSFGVIDTKAIDVDAKNGAIKRISISHIDKNTNVDCDVVVSSQISTETEVDENMNETSLSPLKRPGVAVNLEIKKQKLTPNDSTENSKVLILKTNAIEKISHVIVQPPNYKFVKRTIPHSKYRNDKSNVRNANVNSAGLKQVGIESFFSRSIDATIDISKQLEGNDVSREMNKNLGVIDAAKCERLKTARVSRRDLNESPKSARLPSKRDLTSLTSPRKPENKPISDVSSPRVRTESMSAHSARKNVESLHFNLPIKSKSNKTTLSPRNIPHHKIVSGTHFAVDAFSYGEIPNVKHYFLTHFHSDHYSGLKKTFSKLLFCSKITADLCITRLGVNPKNIRVINIDEVIRVDGVEVTAVDANHNAAVKKLSGTTQNRKLLSCASIPPVKKKHKETSRCPGAIMLAFTLPNGKTLLHTGDFRACPSMESLPIFWNKDIHTIYLDTTYCNPRYDFPTQDQSLEMALYILRQKKMALEKAGKKFSSVLIVCGTYTIGKEKFFLGMSRRVGCSVWACPEKERVLQVVEGRACSRAAPLACQLHVVPMRDLTHEKLRSYLDSLQGAFNEVVAFKPSGWENGKNSSVEKDLVTIHGIPYSEHSSFSELIRFVKFLKPKQVVPTVDISGGVKTVQKYFPCPLVYKDELHCQTKVTDYFSIHNRQQVAAVT